MASYLLKIKYDGTLRRCSVRNRPDNGEPDLTFSNLELKIKDLFQLPSDLKFSITYLDNENDQVTLGDDRDIVDALVIQGLNPLRLDVVPKRSNQNLTVEESVQRQQVDKNAFESIDKRIPGEDFLPIIHPSVTRDLDSDTQAKPNEKTEPVAEDTSYHQTSSSISGSPYSFNQGNRSNPSTDQASFLESSSPPSYITTGFSGKSSQYEDYPLSDPSPVLAGQRNEVFRKDSYEAAENWSPGVSAPVMLAASKEDRVPLYDAPIHYGIQCDSCGMNPIVGSRFKSHRLFDFDLCGNCFQNETDKNAYFEVPAQTETNLLAPGVFRYLRRNTSPAIFRNPIRNNFLSKLNSLQSSMTTMSMENPASEIAPNRNVEDEINPLQSATSTMSVGNPVSDIAPKRSLKGIMDSRVVQDVTVPEGTAFRVETKFTKTWRLKNTGKYPWPMRTKLVRVAGDDLGPVETVITELFNVQPEDEVNVSLVLVAPNKPGSYVSHWRLTIPSGEKFGHRMWVLIESIASQDPKCCGDQL